MAIDKSRTPTWMKVVLIIIIATFVLGVGGGSIVGFCAEVTPPTASTQTGTSSQNASATLLAFESNFGPLVKANDEALKKEPKNYDLLLRQAETYAQWGSSILQSAEQGLDANQQPNETLLLAGSKAYGSAVPFYERAQKVKPDPKVEGDLAVARFYSGDVQGAITEGEKVRRALPTFAPNVFNLGIFYRANSQYAQSIAAFQAYLKLDPKGDKAQAAKDLIAELQSAQQAPQPPAQVQPPAQTPGQPTTTQP